MSDVKEIYLNPNRAMNFEAKPFLKDPVTRTAMQICDPLANSELARLEDEVSSLRAKVSEVETLRQKFESYALVTQRLAMEVSAYHKVFKTIGNIDAHNVARLTASIFIVPLADMMGTARPTYLCHPRMAAMYVMKTRLGMTLEAVGGFFQKDHGTVMHAVKKVESLMEKNEQFAKKVNQIIEALNIKEELVPASLIGHSLVALPPTKKGPKKKEACES